MFTIYTFKRTGSGPAFLRDGKPLPSRITKHSPSGWDWGGGGSGCQDLALNILMDFLVVNDSPHAVAQATSLYSKFCVDFIGPMAYEGGEIAEWQIGKWLNQHLIDYRAGPETAWGPENVVPHPVILQSPDGVKEFERATGLRVVIQHGNAVITGESK